jgi:hypothetical protein
MRSCGIAAAPTCLCTGFCLLSLAAAAGRQRRRRMLRALCCNIAAHSHTLLLCRGYPVSYLANVLDKLETTLEATTCESLLVDRNELLAGASQIPKGVRWAECA